MPTYAYTCTECGHSFDIHQSFSDEALTECPNCGGKLRKLFSSVGVVFKGSGFYRTDSRSGSTSSSAPAKSGTASTGTSGASGSSTSGGTTSAGSGSTSGASNGASGSSSSGGASSGSGSSSSGGSAPAAS